MIESRLYKAAQLLPEPVCTYSQIEEKAYQNRKASSFNTHQSRRVAAIVACVLLLMSVSVAVAATTEVNYSAWAKRSNDFGDVEIIGENIGVVLPEVLDDSPFYNITTMYVAPEGTTYLDALTNPAYPWYSVDYGVQEIVREYNSDEPDSGFSENSVVYDEYSISFGSTNDELFKYVFSLDEYETRILENALPGSYRTEEYNGVTMQIVTDVQYDRENDSEIFAYHHRVIWVDANNHAVFSLHKSFYAEEEAADQFPSEMIKFAKEIIDLNISQN